MNLPNRVVWVLAVAFTITAVISAVLVFNVVRELVASWSEVGLPQIFAGGGGSTGAGDPGEGGVPGAQPTLSLDTEQYAWNGAERINILLMGLDFRDWESGNGPPRTDSMMLLTLDPISETGGMLSIPRDLWVEIPGFEHNRINTAYFLGETYRIPGGGPQLAMDTVSNLLGVPVQYYTLIEFSAFEQMVDEIGGIELLVEEQVKISPIGRESHILLPKAYKLDGSETLAYARARKTEGGDFDRARRQQQVAMAIRDQILDLQMIPTLLVRAPALYTELASGIHTNLTLEQMVSLGLLALRIDLGNITRGVIAPPDMILLESLPDGSQVLKPVPDQIRLLRDEIFTGTGAIRPAAVVNSPLEGAIEEDARLSVLNGAGVEGLATETGDYLEELGLTVIERANADRLDYDKSRLIVHSQNYPYTVRYLSELLGLSQGQILTPISPLPEVDLVLILGLDWVYSRP